MRPQTKKIYEKSGETSCRAKVLRRANWSNGVPQKPKTYFSCSRTCASSVSCCCFFTYSLSYSSSTASNPVNAPHRGPTMSNKDILPEFAIPAKTPSEPGVYQTSPTRKFIRPKASPQSALEKGTPEVPGSNGPAYCNAKRLQVVTRSGRISRLYPKSEDFVT